MTALSTLAQHVAALGVCATLVFSLTACGSSSGNAPTDKDDEPGAIESSSEETLDGPDWANPVTTPGEKLTTINVGDVSVDVHQVDVVASPQTGDWVDKETNERIINKGDEIVFVNFVITNTGDPIDLDSNVVEVSGMYTDWEYVNRMPSITDDELFKKMRVNSEAVDFNAADPSDYTLGTDETFAYGTNFRYQQNSDIIFSAQYTPVDESGEQLNVEKSEAKTTIK